MDWLGQTIFDNLDSPFNDEENEKIARNVASAIRESIGKVAKEIDNPYPASIFPTMSPEELKTVSNILKREGMTLDRISGSWGRQVWDMAIKELLRRLL